MRVLELSELDLVGGGCGRTRRRCGNSSWGKGSGKSSCKTSGKSSGKSSGMSSGKDSGKTCTPAPVVMPEIPQVP